MAKKIDLFLSGSENLGTSQLDISASLGGWASDTPAPKNLPNSLFTDISSLDLKTKSPNTIALFLKNSGDEEIESIDLKQIYQNLFGSRESWCKFEWAVVLPIDGGRIEQIGSSLEQPYYADFFEPYFIRENSTMTINSAGQIGDLISILGIEFNATGTSKDSLANDIVLAFKNNPIYKVQKKSEDKVYFEKKNEIFDSEQLEIISVGSASSDLTVFSGEDSSFELLANPLAQGEYIGLWIRRSFFEMEDSCVDFTKIPPNEKLEIIFSF